jgi:hypothetical protein
VSLIGGCVAVVLTALGHPVLPFMRWSFVVLVVAVVTTFAVVAWWACVEATIL